jgi:endonuclease-3
MKKTEKAQEIIAILKKHIVNPKSDLNFHNERELTVAVALSAQTTDKKVNEITENLFKKYTSWKDFADADLEELTQDIRGVNFHKGKAQRLKKAGQLVLDEFDGVLPKDINELQKIPGVARKSANVIMQEMWGIAQGIVVDTHISRVSHRLGLTIERKNAKKIEQELMKIIPREFWHYYSSAIVLHGRYTCKARSPQCDECPLVKICPSAFKN